MRAAPSLFLPLLLVLRVGAAAGQEPPAPPTPEAPPEETGARPGLFPVGPFWVTPRLRLGTLGLDTNVFYTATERQTDFVASGGPGVDVVLPGRPVRLLLAGGLDYLFFARTESQRQLTGDARARVELRAQRLRAGLEESYVERFDRPSAEVDERVLRGRFTTSADLALDLGQRFDLTTLMDVAREDVGGQPVFGGTPLDRTLTRDTRRALLGVSYAATGKTSLLAEAELQEDEFPEDVARDTRSWRPAVGLVLESKTRLAARLLAGRRFLRPTDETLPAEERDYVEARLAWHFGPRTRLQLHLLNDVGFSAFDTQGRLPLLDQTSLELRLERGLGHGRELTVFARRLRLSTEAPLTVVAPDGSSQTAPRDDLTREAGLSLTQLYRGHWRAGFTAAWSSRNSVYDDLGVAGLLLGGTLTYVP